MTDDRPSFARQAGVIATIVLWPLLFIAAICLLGIGDTERFDPSLTFVSRFHTLFSWGVTYAAGACVGSLFLARLARIRALWHAAILAVAAFFLSVFAAGSRVVEWLRSLELELTFPQLDEDPMSYLWPMGVNYALQVAILLCAYRLIVYRFLRRRASAKAEPAGEANPPPGDGGGWGGTRAEWRTFFLVFGALVLLGGGGYLVFCEMQRRQIPAPVWALIEGSGHLETLTLDPAVAHPRAELLHGHAIVSRVPNSTPPERAALAAALRRSLNGSVYLMGGIPDATGAIRVTGEGKTYDLLFSFEGSVNLGLLRLYEGDKGLGTMYLFEPFSEFVALFAPPTSDR